MRKIGSSRASPRRRRYFWLAACPAVAGTIAVAMSIFSQSAGAATAPVDLGTAGSFAVLAGSTVTNTGLSVIHGNLGVSPGSAVTGFPPGIVIAPGTEDVGNAVAANAQAALTTAFGDAAGRSPSALEPMITVNGTTLVAGVYQASSSLEVNGALNLDAQGDPSAVFIFQTGSTLVTDSASSINLINGAQACNVFWQVGSSATLGTGSAFTGTILANQSITVTTGDTIHGRALASVGAVTLDDDTITVPRCRTIPTPPTTSAPATGTPTTSAPATGTPTTSAPATGTPTTSAPATGTPTTSAPPTSTGPGGGGTGPGGGGTGPGGGGTGPGGGGTGPGGGGTGPGGGGTGPGGGAGPGGGGTGPGGGGTGPGGGGSGSGGSPTPTFPAPSPTSTSPTPKPTSPKPRPAPKPAPVPKPVGTTFPVTG